MHAAPHGSVPPTALRARRSSGSKARRDRTTHLGAHTWPIVTTEAPVGVLVRAPRRRAASAASSSVALAVSSAMREVRLGGRLCMSSVTRDPAAPRHAGNRAAKRLIWPMAPGARASRPGAATAFYGLTACGRRRCRSGRSPAPRRCRASSRRGARCAATMRAKAPIGVEKLLARGRRSAVVVESAAMAARPMLGRAAARRHRPISGPAPRAVTRVVNDVAAAKQRPVVPYWEARRGAPPARHGPAGRRRSASPRPDVVRLLPGRAAPRARDRRRS